MAKKQSTGDASKVVSTAEAQGQAIEAAALSGAGTPWLRADGAICFGDECAVLIPNAAGKLQLTIKPTKCGSETGRILLEYLMKTAGKGVVIEIPSEIS